MYDYFDSIIVEEIDLKKGLFDLVPNPPKYYSKDMVLIYRMTRDAEYTSAESRSWLQKKMGGEFVPQPIDAIEKFHEKCNNVSPTVTILKSDTGHLFGGYTDIP